MLYVDVSMFFQFKLDKLKTVGSKIQLRNILIIVHDGFL